MQIMYISFFKRIIDIILAFLALIFLLPLLIPVSLILLITGEHEVFYRQKRVGYKNERFKIIKFATMVKNSSKMGSGSITLRNDPRVLPFGRILRKTKINELPQILNVIIGDMSLIGPRPQMEVDFNRFQKKYQDVIYNVKPGITGIGSIVFRDEEKLVSESKMNPQEYFAKYIDTYRCELELWYHRNLNFVTDVKIIFITLWVIIFPESTMLQRLMKTIPPKQTFD
jgi:lipopolysaccharide/colanic/teichoic acid biosynthesis glycosyltransferase